MYIHVRVSLLCVHVHCMYSMYICTCISMHLITICLCSGCSQIVDVNLTSEGKVKLAPGMELPFTYQVCEYTWPD